MSAPLITPEALAERWNLTIATLSQWRWNGRGPHYLKIGRRILYRLQDVEDFEECKLRSSTTQNPEKAQECPRTY